MKDKLPYNIVIIGAGNLATQLAPALQKAGQNIIQIYSRTEESAVKLSCSINAPFTTKFENINPSADIYFLLINDDLIEKFAAKVLINESILIHSSGSIPMQVLSPKAKNYGVLYPIQTLSKNKKVNFREIPVCIEANNDSSLNILKDLAFEITDHVYELDSDQRLKVHLAAVFANNFSNHLINIAKKILEENNISFDLLKPLILETAANALNLGPECAQTGPAKRNDFRVMEKHLELLSCKPDWKEIYNIMSKSIRN